MQGEPECVWSLEVYYRILLWVLRPVNDTAGLVDLRPGTSSRINPHFHRLALPSKMIDCCLVFKPEPGSRVDRRIEELSKTRPGNSINHTDSGSLCRHPIGLSVEVKSREGDALEAEVQMGTWHAAQWRSMRRHAPDKAAVEFLPGIIISGHEWYFVATLPPQHSPDPFTGGTSKPTLYSRMHLGSTSDEQGVCKIVASLRCLVDWLEREYWPAFQEEVLGLPPG
ncbi:uncharacterized protein F5Z01DRAFT_683689 [Emericellopsis atlantica]|uniref:PD-(D/E)XK nuclease-like domain-containing protein n=1 Tax=Emericellopsis atlantica TaxID=2614577 RepID=A0A9P7ZF49_9HYPO|nr:uncharacterized protein F5Z01DRAFT_683689 [Emericellopsis atlantica]KAG9250840.1 hypothetical protein F5Z01DRAFT_683689 [Emericellopsis atlantica]